MKNSNTLRKLSNQELDQNLKSLVHQERELLTEILHHIFEVDRRRLYLEIAYPNLFTYLTEHLGYSHGSAQRRLEAARLLKEVPDLTERIEEGHLKLSQIALVQKSLRQTKKDKGRTLSAPEKRDLFTEISGKSHAETEVIVARALELEIQRTSHLHYQADESVRLEMTFTREEWAQLQHMRELLSNSLPNGSDWKEAFVYLADRVITQKTKTSRSPRPSADSAHVSTSVRKHVMQRDQCCQFRDARTGRQCGSKWRLNVDHQKPLWDQGKSSPENLQILCANHNQQRYRQQANLQRA